MDACLRLVFGTKIIIKMSRYFMVSYVGTTVTGDGKVTGCASIRLNSGLYLNRNETTRSFESGEIKLKNVVITNIQELNESDYNDWIA